MSPITTTAITTSINSDRIQKINHAARDVKKYNQYISTVVSGPHADNFPAYACNVGKFLCNH